MINDGHVVSVIIPTTERKSLDFCKAALERQTRPPNEVIIITDSERKGPAWSRNQGLKQAHGDLIAFTDDDCIPPDDWLERLIHAIDKYEAMGAGGTLAETDPLLHDQRLRRGFPEVEEVDTVGWVGDGANVMYKRAWLDFLVRRDGYIFNELFKISQDLELAWRLRLYGAKLIFVPNKVTHLRHLTPLKYLCHRFYRGTGIANLFIIQRSVDTPITQQASLIWGHGSSGKESKWLKAFWYKIIGPFDRISFRQARHFWLFWLGEKLQALGFLWGLLTQRLEYKPAVEKPNLVQPDN